MAGKKKESTMGNTMGEQRDQASEVTASSLLEKEQGRPRQYESELRARLVYGHEDGHGLNDRIAIRSDRPDPDNGGAAHHYEFRLSGVPVGAVQFQHGPRNAALSRSGITEAALLVVLIDRVKSFQDGPFACRENEHMLRHLEEALLWTKARADGRARRGVLGQARA